MNTAAELVETLQLTPHPEGGYYREIYRSEESIPWEALPQRFGGSRQFCTAIYYLLEAGDFSAFHRIASDELWHFYAGGTLELFILPPAGELEIIKLGSNLSAGERFAYAVPAGYWFASRPARGVSYSLLGCTVSPGFDFSEFEMAERRKLSAEFPRYDDVIRELTNPKNN